MNRDSRWGKLQLYKGGEARKPNMAYCIVVLSTMIILVMFLVVAVIKLLCDVSAPLILKVISATMAICIVSLIEIYLLREVLKYAQWFRITDTCVYVKSVFAEYALLNDKSVYFEIAKAHLNRSSREYNKIIRLYKEGEHKLSFCEKMHFFHRNGKIALQFAYSDELMSQLQKCGYTIIDKTFLVKNSPWQSEDAYIYDYKRR